MLNYSKVATLIDDVADKLQEMGYTKEAEHLDIISNTIESMDPEAGLKDLARKAVLPALTGLSMLGAPAQGATEQYSEFAPTTQTQMENLKKTDPKSYKILKDQEEQKKLDIAQRAQSRKPMGPTQNLQFPDNPDEVAGQYMWTNTQGGFKKQIPVTVTKSGKVIIQDDEASEFKGKASDFIKMHGNQLQRMK